ncbi:fumarylacetoacetate hydrolase family protein [Streptomyces sp. 6N106]|uniref:fumarylacetoacetate hydrolase family protein n=1 Tax=Streptomyces sp. 6N106 TaxID=3457418 RepID=UPI003FCEECEB
MRIVNVAGRLALLRDGRAVDVQRAGAGRFAADPQAVYERWEEFRAWADTADLPEGEPFAATDLGPPTPLPRQTFAIGLNYRDHAAESGFDVPEGLPLVFTKYATAISEPVSQVRLPEGGHTDWEVELVAVIGRRTESVSEADAWDHVAGLTAGQDISERLLQQSCPAPQFSVGKSYPGFAPLGPCLVTPDEFNNPDDLALSCTVNGEEVQKDRTRDLIFPVPTLIARLSTVLPLLPGDVIFTGTPADVGFGRSPQRWLAPGDELVSFVEGVGELRQTFVA